MLALHRNENVFGMSPTVRFVLQSSCSCTYQYPGDEIRLLRRILAREAGLDEACVALAAGSTEVLRLALAHWLRVPGTRLFCTRPVYPPVLALAGALAPVTQVPHDRVRRVDLPALRRAVARHEGPSVVYLSNPDCHSGELLPRATLSAWLGDSSAQTRFIVDEAYMEFVPPEADASLAPLLSSYPERLLVLRTFSKAYGLAGLRMGYGLSACPLPGAGTLALATGPLAVRSVLEALDDQAWLQHALSLQAVARTHLQQGLAARGIDWVSGQGNFVLHALPDACADFNRSLRPYGIRVAHPLDAMPGWCRTSVASVPDMNYYLSVLSTLGGEG